MGKCQCSSHVGGENNRRGLVGSPPEVSMKRPWPAGWDWHKWQWQVINAQQQDQVSGMEWNEIEMSTPSRQGKIRLHNHI